VQRRRWLRAEDFERAIAATGLLPGPSSTQLAIYCAWRLRGTAGALVGGACFVLPAVLIMLPLSAAFLGSAPPAWLRGAGAGAGAAVAAVALHAGLELARPIWGRTPSGRRGRVIAYGLAGAIAAAVTGPWLVLVLLGCGGVELLARRGARLTLVAPPWPLAAAMATGGLGALAWTAFKVGALSYGGGFVIIPLMQSDAVRRYHWLSDGQFLYAVALGQITPGPVVHTVAVVGYAAAGIGGGLLAAAVAFAPSFLFVILGAPHFDTLRANAAAQSFLTGAGAGAIGAIAGSSILLGLGIGHLWQFGVLALAAIWLLVLRRGVVPALLGSAALGVLAALIGLPVSA
jgi:chromate transporter